MLNFQRTDPNPCGEQYSNGQHVLSNQGSPGLITAFSCYAVLWLLTRYSVCNIYEILCSNVEERFLQAGSSNTRYMCIHVPCMHTSITHLLLVMTLLSLLHLQIAASQTNSWNLSDSRLAHSSQIKGKWDGYSNDEERLLQSGAARLWKGCAIVSDSYVFRWEVPMCAICYGKKPAKRP